MRAPITEIILQSDSFSSLKAEREIALRIHKLGWKSVHGFYFKDPETGKNRELDVAAEKYWHKTISNIYVRATVSLLIEVKTMKGFHLFVSERESSTDELVLEHIIWAGDSHEKYQYFISAISSLDVTAAEINAFLKALNYHAYPNGFMRRPIASTHVRPPKVLLFNAFRETNIGGEKSLDSSVFWKASESLRSAYESIRLEHRTQSTEAVQAYFEIAKRSHKRWLDEAIRYSKDELNYVKVVHPIVFTDANIWRVDSSTAKEVPYARFVMQNSLHSADWWCDVVNSAHLDTYLKYLSKHYSGRMFKSRPLGYGNGYETE